MVDRADRAVVSAAADRRGDWRFLLPYFGRERRRLVVLAVVLLGATAAALASPFLVREFIDGVVSGGLTPERTSLLIVAFAVLGVAQFVDGGDEPVAGRQPPPWGPERIDERMRDPLQRYDHHFTDPPAGAL